MAQPPSSNHQQGAASSTLHQVRSCLCLHSDPKVSIQLPARALESFATCFITRCEFRCVAPPLIVANACFVGHTHTLTQTVTMLCVCGGWHCPWRLSICQCPVHFTSLHFALLLSSGSTSVGPTHHVGWGRRHWHSLTRVYLAAAQAFDRRQ